MIGRTAQLTFHPVEQVTDPRAPAEEPSGQDPGGARTLPDPDAAGAFLRLGPAALTGEGVRGRRGAVRHRAGQRLECDRRLPRRCLRPVGGADRSGRLPGSGRPAAPGGHRAGRPRGLRTAHPAQRPLPHRDHRRLHADHRRLRRRGGQGPGGPRQGRRAARTRRGGRAADGGSHAGRRRHPGERSGSGRRADVHGSVPHPRLPPAGRAGHPRPRGVRPALLRGTRRSRSHADAAGTGRIRPRHRHGGRRQRPGLRTRPGGLRPPRHAAGQGPLRTGSAAGAADRFPAGVQRRHRLQRHHTARRRAAVRVRDRAGQGIRRDALAGRAGLDGLRDGRHTGARRVGRAAPRRAAAPRDHRSGGPLAAARPAGLAQAAAGAPPRPVAGRDGRTGPGGPRRDRTARPRVRRGVHRGPPDRVQHRPARRRRHRTAGRGGRRLPARRGAGGGRRRGLGAHRARSARAAARAFSRNCARSAAGSRSSGTRRSAPASAPSCGTRRCWRWPSPSAPNCCI